MKDNTKRLLELSWGWLWPLNRGKNHNTYEEKSSGFDNWPLKTGWALNTVQLNTGLTVRGFDNWIQQRSLHDHSENLLIIKLCMGRALEINFPHGGGNLNEPIFKSLNVWCGEGGKVWMPGVGREEKVQATNWSTHYVLPCNKCLNKRSVL